MASSTAVDFGALVAAQLTALIEAEGEAAMRTTEFIEAVGIDVASDGTRRLRMVAFDMERRDTDGTVRTHTIRVPMLTLVTIPLLSIASADLEFELTVERMDPVQEPPPPDDEKARRQQRRRMRLAARLARKRGSGQPDAQETTRSDVRMKVRVEASPFPLGIERLLNAADLAVTDDTRPQAIGGSEDEQ